ncbi:MAG: lysophospholipid acyltransferase family protein [Adhaeribacter sp.]
MLYFLLKIIFKTSLRVFFRKMEVRNAHLIPAEGPLVLVANHPNTFMDPIAIAAIARPQVYFIAKSTLFKSALQAWLLHKMNLVPIFRREDGGPSGQANDQTFRKCYELLHRKGTLLIFPEGNSFNERRLRPLKTGAARIALEAEAQAQGQAGIRIVPIGLNYSDPTRFRSELFINVGEPLVVADFASHYAQDSFKAAQSLTDAIRRSLEELLVIAASQAEEELIREIEGIYKYDLLQDLGLSRRQEDKFVLTKGIADSIRYFSQHDPNRVRALQDQLQAYLQQLKQLGLQDKFLRVNQAKSRLAPGSLRTGLFLLLGWPVYLFGCLTSYLPYILPSKVADNFFGEEEFRAPVMMTAGIFSFLGIYSLEVLGIYKWSGSWQTALGFGLLLPFAGFFALEYYYRLVNTRGYLRLLSGLFRRQPRIEQVLRQRADLIQNLEQAKRVYMNDLALAGPGKANS